MWRGFRKLERRFGSWLAQVACPAILVVTIRWALRACIVAFPFLNPAAFVVLFAIALLVSIGISSGRNADLSATFDEPQWRDGFAGYGEYTHGVRTDAGRLFENEEES
jgi:hypothetical protein